MRVAAVQMTAEPGIVDANLKSARRLTEKAFEAGAQLVVLPEFFTSAMAFSPSLVLADRPVDGEPFLLMKELAAKHNGAVGGSFIADVGGRVLNRFVLVFADGKSFFHDKDQPTMWENCYYEGGEDDGVLDTPLGNIGVALCWEFVRCRTARRLIGRVDLVVGGSCWWTLPQKSLPGFGPNLHAEMLEVMKQTPARMARMLGVPVVHAAHAGSFAGRMPLLPGFPYNSHLLGETMITDASGQILARLPFEHGEGFVIADLDLAKKSQPLEPIPQGFWIPKLPRRIRAVWAYQNLHGAIYRRLVTNRARRARDKA
ncbi:MAG: carbon-nitrogen hydrolase family protein [Desulfatibacillaceae bacterium]|nr:carbon-nitrogen hydrolase family protein [Desulfatibacillaceae bacterium]